MRCFSNILIINSFMNERRAPHSLFIEILLSKVFHAFDKHFKLQTRVETTVENSFNNI
jgi:hypothetical protein